MKKEITNEIINNLIGLRTDDYQNRGGNYPTSDVPDTIDVYREEKSILIECLFKNTDEYVARNWLENKLVEIGIDVDELDIGSCQDGDYQDDWVKSYVSINL